MVFYIYQNYKGVPNNFPLFSDVTDKEKEQTHRNAL